MELSEKAIPFFLEVTTGSDGFDCTFANNNQTRFNGNRD